MGRAGSGGDQIHHWQRNWPWEQDRQEKLYGGLDRMTQLSRTSRIVD